MLSPCMFIIDVVRLVKGGSEAAPFAESPQSTAPAIDVQYCSTNFDNRTRRPEYRASGSQAYGMGATGN